MVVGKAAIGGSSWVTCVNKAEVVAISVPPVVDAALRAT